MKRLAIRDLETEEVLGDYEADQIKKKLVIYAILAMPARNEIKKDSSFTSIEAASTPQMC